MLPLVLLPGMNCTTDLWPEELRRGEHVLTPTLGERSMDAQVDALLCELPERFALVGLSLGGIVAMALASKAPERVTGLCVAATNAKAPTAAQQQGWQTAIRRIDEGESAREQQRSILSLLLSPAAASAPVLVERVLTMGDDVGAALLREQLLLQTTRVDLRDGLRRVGDKPTLVICGQHDVLCPPENHTEIVASVPRGRLVSLDAGHLLPMERPREFTKMVHSWHETLGG